MIFELLNEMLREGERERENEGGRRERIPVPETGWGVDGRRTRDIGGGTSALVKSDLNSITETQVRTIL